MQPTTLRIVQPPPVAGFWELPGGGVRFAVQRRPAPLHRFLTRWLLGWRWFDPT